MKKFTLTAFIVLSGIAVILASLLFRLEAPRTIVPSQTALLESPQKSILTSNLAQAAPPALPQLSLTDIAEKAAEAVVNISSTKVVKMGGGEQFSPFFSDPFFRHFFGIPPSGGAIPQERRQSSLGSGVVITEDGYILTNNHVIDKADEVKVFFSEDKKEYTAKIIGSDPKSDLAVLKIEAKGLKTLKFGDSSKLRLAEIVLAIGNPFGVGKTVTMGIVSALGRANMGIVDYEDFIQTDAAINPGNSGGALINASGELVGINTAIVSRSGGYQGIGFAIPSDMAKPIFESIVKHGKVIRGWLGIVIQDLNEELASSFGLDSPTGVLVSDVEEGSPADKAGFKRGDVVLELNGEKMTSSNHLRNLVAALSKDAKVKVKILRDKKEMILEATLGEFPDKGKVSALSKEESSLLAGLTLSDISQELIDKYNLPKKIYGVVVTNIQTDSPVAASGLQEGDVIMELDRQRIKNLEHFRALVKKNKNKLLLLVFRDGYSIFIMLRK